MVKYKYILWVNFQQKHYLSNANVPCTEGQGFRGRFPGFNKNVTIVSSSSSSVIIKALPKNGSVFNILKIQWPGNVITSHAVKMSPNLPEKWYH